MDAKYSDGTFVVWEGEEGEPFRFNHIPVPLNQYQAEPWGGVLIIASEPFYEDFQIFEVSSLRDEVHKLSVLSNEKAVFWYSARKQEDRDSLIKGLGKRPKYVG